MKLLISVFILLIASSSIYAKNAGTPKDKWLSNLENILPAHLCKKESPFLKIYKGKSCSTDMTKLFKKCTTEVDNVIIPNILTSVPQANIYGQVIATCMTAYYQGGSALKVFNLMQEVMNKRRKNKNG